MLHTSQLIFNNSAPTCLAGFAACHVFEMQSLFNEDSHNSQRSCRYRFVLAVRKLSSSRRKFAMCQPTTDLHAFTRAWGSEPNVVLAGTCWCLFLCVYIAERLSYECLSSNIWMIVTCVILSSPNAYTTKALNLLCKPQSRFIKGTMMSDCEWFFEIKIYPEFINNFLLTIA